MANQHIHAAAYPGIIRGEAVQIVSAQMNTLIGAETGFQHRLPEGG
jgi:hypothetical protein